MILVEQRGGLETVSLDENDFCTLNHCILVVYKSQNNENLRYQVLTHLIKAVPVFSAAFFISNPGNNKYAGCLIAQPVGTEQFTSDFERLVNHIRSREKDSDLRRYGSIVLTGLDNESVSPNCIAESRRKVTSVLLCDFTHENKLLGTLVLTRAQDQEPFSPRDAFALGVLEPHISQHLHDIISSDGVQEIQVDMLFEEYDLTQREIEVVSCVAFGMAPAEIAGKLTISPSTVKKHLENIYRKTGVKNRTSLMRLAQQYMS